MTREQTVSKGRVIWPIVVILVAGLATGLVILDQNNSRVPEPRHNATTKKTVEPEALAQQINVACSTCHAYPPPSSFPKSSWEEEVKLAYGFARNSKYKIALPPIEEVTEYYMSHAPEKFPTPEIQRATGPCPVNFQPIRDQASEGTHGISHVNLVHLFDKKRLEILACDMKLNHVKLLRPYQQGAKWQILAKVEHPAHAEVVDLDGDGHNDVLVAALGYLTPTDLPFGEVVWLRGSKSGKFTPIRLLEGVGRVADVQAADFNDDGKLDLIVAVFGWRERGNLLLLDNCTTDWSQPKFKKKILDDRHGAIHVPIADLNGDGKKDFVCLFSQEHETIVAFLSTGDGFRKETIYTAPHPAYGSSGIQLTDLDKDGDLDVLYTNGDVLDSFMLRPDHSVQWLENKGNYPFVHHPITPFYGAHRALAADFDKDGDQDIVAVSFLPLFLYGKEKQQDSILLLEQVSPGKFARHSIETNTCEHATCAVGDLFGDGRMHFVTGNLEVSQKRTSSIVMWQNKGPVASSTSSR